MELKNLVDINYLKRLSDNPELLKEALNEDLGVLLEQMSELKVCPSDDILLSFNCPQADYFLLKKFKKEKKDTNILYQRGLVSFQTEEKENVLYHLLDKKYLAEKPVYQSKNKLSFNIPSFPSHLYEEGKLLALIEYSFNQKEMFFNESKAYSLNSIDSLFDSLFADKEKLNEILIYPEVTNLLKNTIQKHLLVNFKDISAIWEHDFDLNLLKKLYFDKNDSREVVDIVLSTVKKKNLDINDIFEFLPLDFKFEVLKNESDFNLSNKALNYFLKNNNESFNTFIKQRNFISLPEAIKLQNGLCDILDKFDELGKEEKLFEINEVDNKDIFDLIISCTKKLNSNDFENEEILFPIKRRVFLFIDRYSNLSLSIDKNNIFNDFIKALKIEFMKYDDCNSFVFEIKRNNNPNTFDVGSDNLRKLRLIEAYSNNGNKEYYESVLKRMLVNNGSLITDYLTILKGGDVELSSPIFKDPFFKPVNGLFDPKMLSLFSDSMQEKIFRKWEVNWNLEDLGELIPTNSFKNFIKFTDKYDYSTNSTDLNLAIFYGKKISKDFNFNEIKDYLSKANSYKEKYGEYSSNRKKIFNEVERESKYRELQEDLFFLNYSSRFAHKDSLLKDSLSFQFKSMDEVLAVEKILPDGIKKSFSTQCSYIFNKVKNREEDSSIPLRKYCQLLGIKSDVHFNLTTEDKVYVLKQIFKNNKDHYLQDLKSFNTHFNFNEILGNKSAEKEVMDYICENSPSVILSQYYSGFKPVYNFDLIGVYNLYKNVNDDLGILFKRSGSNDNESMIKDVVINSSEEEFWEVVNKSKEEFPEFYTVLMSYSLVRTLSSDGNALDSQYGFWATENNDSKTPIESFLWDLIDLDVMAEGYHKIKMKAIELSCENHFSDRVLLSEDFSSSFMNAFIYLSNQNNIVDKAKDFIPKLIDKGLDFSLSVMGLENLNGIEEPIAKYFSKKIKTVDDACQFLFAFVGSSKNSENLGDDICLKKIKKYMMDTQHYQIILTNLCKHVPGFVEFAYHIIENSHLQLYDSVSIKGLNDGSKKLVNIEMDNNINVFSEHKDTKKTIDYFVDLNQKKRDRDNLKLLIDNSLISNASNQDSLDNVFKM